MAAATELLRLDGVTKRFGHLRANDGVHLTVRVGEVHAVVGENGAGKTTLMRTVFGMHRPDEGRVLWSGEPVTLATPADAMRLGIGMVHQHFMLVPSFTAAENVTLGAEPGRRGLFDRRAAERRTSELADRLGVRIDPAARTGTLTVATQQKVEILKALHRGARLLILDEPTAVLTPQECVELFALLRELTGTGYSVVFISHKLPEVLAVADRITVMRRGRTVATLDRSEADGRRLAHLMTGREDVNLGRLAGRHEPGERTVLDLRDVATDPRGEDHPLRSASLRVRAGEIVGVAGVDGNGQTALAEAVVGLRRTVAGRILLAGSDLDGLDVRGRRERGLAFVPEDRHLQGLPLGATVAEAMVAARSRRLGWRAGFRPAVTAEDRRWCAEQIRRYEVHGADPGTRCQALSGGNQQKVVLARELAGGPRCLVLAQPTRGVDIGAVDFVHRQVVAQAAAGCATLLVSADLDEIFRLSDRVVVLYRGATVLDRPVAQTDRDEVGLHMMGAGA
jgi:simple sugar transport system ATP-binding protein